MGNGLLLALASSGNGLSPATLKAVMQMRQRNYEKLAAFIKWLATTLVYGYYWLKDRPKVVNQDGKPDYTGEGTQKFIDAFWARSDQKDFLGNLIRDGANLILEWLKPDDFESQIWQGLVGQASPAAQAASTQLSTNQLLMQLQQLLAQNAAPPASNAASEEARRKALGLGR